MSDVPKMLQYLAAMGDYKASDLYLTVGFPPTLRGDGGLMKIGEDTLDLEDMNDLVNSILTSRQKREFASKMELNTALDLADHGRFRVNVLKQRQAPALVVRRIISEIPSFADLRLPRILEKLSMEKRGLVLLTGMTGSGKSTSLAAMVDYRNRHEEGHIITIEDPIEYFHEHKRCVITQREVGVDTESYASAMKNALRQRPDVILVGEIRDREVMEQALTTAETGHLCLATIHTNNSYQAIERIVNLFPDDLHPQIRLNLSLNLKAIMSQRLIPSKQGGGLVPAIEVMLNEGLVRELVLKGQISKISSVMEQSNSIGMCTFDQSLLELYRQGLIDEKTVLANSDKPSDMKIKLQQIQLGKETDDDGNILSAMDTSVISLSE